MPFKRKSKGIESEWPDIAVSGKISCSSQNNSLSLSYISAGSKCTSLHTTLSSSTKSINSNSFIWHTPKVSVELLEIIFVSFKKVLEKNTKHAKCKQQKCYSGYKELLRRVICVLIIFAVVLDSVNASILDLNLRKDSQILALAQTEKRHVNGPLTYPNCSQDFHCPEDQVCKFRSVSVRFIERTSAVLNGPEVNSLYF